MQFKCVEFVEELMYGDLRRKPTPKPDAATPASAEPAKAAQTTADKEKK